VFPVHGWLPRASVAPTPVTALLHAVAVVKAGVFGIARITYYCFGTAILLGTFAQRVMMSTAIATIVFGSFMALRTPHLKRRLAYSTISNLSYIVFALSLMTGQGLQYGMLHMVSHAVIKMNLFFCAGAILVKTGVEYVSDLKGFGKRMPVTMACFVVSSLGLIGVPPLAAFRSKWGIAQAALSLGSPLAVAGVAALIFSEFFTVLYLFQPIVNAYFAKNEAAPSDPTRYMTVPVSFLAALSVVMALGASGLISVIGGLV
jgi:multicomponent Na+:H+ antiporter subunit D